MYNEMDGTSDWCEFFFFFVLNRRLIKNYEKNWIFNDVIYKIFRWETLILKQLFILFRIKSVFEPECLSSS